MVSYFSKRFHFRSLIALTVILILSQIYFSIYIDANLWPSPSFTSNITDISNYQRKLLWKGFHLYHYSPVAVYLLYNSTLNQTSNFLRLLFEFNTISSPYPESLQNALRIKCESNTTIMRFSSKNFNVTYTNQPNSLILQTIIQVTGVFDSYFSIYFLPLFSTTLRFDTIDVLKPGQSAMQCHGGHWWNAWCELWNVCWKWKRFHFYSDTVTFFKLRIAYPGSRPVPNDYLSCRIIFRIIADHVNRDDFKDEIERVYHDLSFLTCRWNGMQHFWHVLFDYTIPLWWAMRINGANFSGRESRIFTLDDKGSEQGYQFCDSLSQYSVENIRKMPRNNLSCWDKAILGVPKSEREVMPSLWSNGYHLPYEYPHEAVIGMREHFLTFYNNLSSYSQIAHRCTPSSKNPRIVFIFRSSRKRHIENKEELLNATKRWCKECIIDYFYARNESNQNQINFVCNASLIVGIHGGGLSHMLFQQESTKERPTAVLEILPYMYRCRDWYRWAAQTAKVRYFAWMNDNISNTKPYNGKVPSSHYCYQNETECASDKCHDFLRDQLTKIDLDENGSFKKVMMRAISYIRGKSKFDDKYLANQTDYIGWYKFPKPYV